MPKRFEQHTVFITGGSAGIGAALGATFAAEGARVALGARREDKLAQTVAAIQSQGGTALGVQCDVTNRASIDHAVESIIAEFETLDVVVANAGFGVSGLFERLTTDDYRRQFETNFFGVLDTADAALPHLVERRGRLAVVSSVFGKLGGPTYSAYCASKFALCGWAESVYYELAAKGVSVTCINPGVVESDFRMTDNQGQYHPDRADPAHSFIVMPAAKAARHMVNAIYKRKFEATITLHGRAAVVVSRHFPRTFRTLFRAVSKNQLSKIEQRKRNLPEPTEPPPA